MQDLINLGKKVVIAGGKEAMNYFRKPNLDFDIVGSRLKSFMHTQ